MLSIRRAEERDTEGVLRLLSQVLEVHAEIRPDLFVSGTRKYTKEEVQQIFRDENRPVFVAVDEEDQVVAYCFCILQQTEHANNLRDSKSLFIDDFCVDERCRGQHVGRLHYPQRMGGQRPRDGLLQADGVYAPENGHGEAALSPFFSNGTADPLPAEGP